MKRDEIDALISRLTADAKANPDRFLHQVARFAFLGYTYIGFVLVLMAAFLAGLVAMVVVVPNGFTAKIALVRKQVRHLPQSPCYVLAIDVRRPFWKPVGSDENQQLVNRVLARFESPVYILTFVTEGELKPVGKKIRKVDGSVIYNAGAS